MNLLLDTHVVLWWLDDDPALGVRAREAIADPDNTVYLSAVVVWEIRIKQALGKLDVPEDFEADPRRSSPSSIFRSRVQHAHAIARLPAVHRDPFDRMLVAQAQSEGFRIVTRDSRIAQYGVSVLDA